MSLSSPWSLAQTVIFEVYFAMTCLGNLSQTVQVTKINYEYLLISNLP